MSSSTFTSLKSSMLYPKAQIIFHIISKTCLIAEILITVLCWRHCPVMQLFFTTFDFRQNGQMLKWSDSISWMTNYINYRMVTNKNKGFAPFLSLERSYSKWSTKVENSRSCLVNGFRWHKNFQLIWEFLISFNVSHTCYPTYF